jgi:hypothetical protein
MRKMNQTFTLTFGDQGENHKGMQKIGKMSDKGFSLGNLLKAKKYFEERDIKVEIYHLNRLLNDKDLNKIKKPQNAYVLVARKGVNVLVDFGNNADNLYEEQDALEKDKKAFMYGRVVNKSLRYNLCFAEEAQEPNYEEGKGRIVSYEEVPIMSNLRDNLKLILPEEKVKDLIVEGNYYYDITKCCINAHGDSERKKVIGVRLGASFKFHYQWYGLPEYDEEATKKAKKKNSKARDRYSKKMLGPRLEINLNHGDLYIMSEKAVGTDWMSKNVATLRHSAGEVGVLKDLNEKSVNGDECLFENFSRDEDNYVIVEFE